MDFSLSPEIDDVRQRVRKFVAREVMPLEENPANYDEHENIRLDVLDEVRARAKAEGLWAPQMPKELGGMGLPHIGWAAIYEEANRSLFGPCAINCAAPDDGNMNVLSKVATPEQKERWLMPIIRGEARSAFVMTEPHPGSGSDPTMMLTTAEKKNDRYIVRGRKWFITGAAEAKHFILLARTSDDPRKGMSAFLFDRDDPGWRIDRRIPIMGPEEHGGHCELVFEGLEIPMENRLMEEGDGLKLTQIRLGPARLTHCMRWLGLAKRCMEIAQTYANEREGFGVRLSNRESIQVALGDVAADIEIGRLLTMKAAISCPIVSSGKPTTATSTTCGWRAITRSSSCGATLTPPRTMTSASRSTSVRNPSASKKPRSPGIPQPSPMVSGSVVTIPPGSTSAGATLDVHPLTRPTSPCGTTLPVSSIISTRAPAAVRPVVSGFHNTSGPASVAIAPVRLDA